MTEQEQQRLAVITSIDQLSRSQLGRTMAQLVGLLLRRCWCSSDCLNKAAVRDLLGLCDQGHVGYVIDELQRRGW